jgi:hypothetical protein
VGTVAIETGEGDAAARAAIDRAERDGVRTAVWVGETGTAAYAEFEAEVNGQGPAGKRRAR